MPKHDFATAAEVVELTTPQGIGVWFVCVTPDQLRDRVGCAYLIYTAQGVRAAGLQLALLIYARI